MLVASPPACLHVPPGIRGTYRDDVGELMELAGRPLDPHQLVAVEALTSYVRGGKWPTFTAGVEGPRQTVGKTGGIMLPIALFLCLTFPELADERTWTAHRLDTTSKTFRDARQLLGVDGDREFWSGPLSSRVRNVGLENGNEHVEFVNGSILWFKARSSRAGRGLSGHDVFADELLFADDEQFGAVLPTMATRSAQGQPRLWTASSSAKAASVFLRRLRGQAVKHDPTVTYVGWWARGSWDDPGCATEGCTHIYGAVQGCALDDPGRRWEANPGLGARTSPAFLGEMRSKLSPLEFGREFLGWQEAGEDEAGTKIAPDAWTACADRSSSIVGAPVLTLDVALDRSWSCIAAAGYAADGRVHVEVTAYRPGTGWVVAELARQAGEHGALAVALDPKGPAGSLVPELEREGVTVTLLGLADQVAACGGLVDAVKGRTVVHLDDPVLLGALASSVPREVGDGWAWGRRKSAGDICPLVAGTEAYWQATLHCDRPGDGEVGGWWV